MMIGSHKIFYRSGGICCQFLSVSCTYRSIPYGSTNNAITLTYTINRDFRIFRRSVPAFTIRYMSKRNSLYNPYHLMWSIYFGCKGGSEAWAISRSPSTVGVPRLHLGTLCEFRGRRNGVWLGFAKGFLPFSSYTNFIPLFLLSYVIYFISPSDGAKVWSAGILDIHWLSILGRHHISSLDPALTISHE